MIQHRFLTIRVRKEQLDRIKNKAAQKGYENVSEYMRSILLDEDTTTSQKVSVIYNILTNKENDAKPKILEKPLLAYFKK